MHRSAVTTFLGAIVWLSLAQWSCAQMEQMSFVTISTRQVAPLRVNAEYRAIGNMSVGNTRVTISSTGPSPADRQLTVVFYYKTWSSSQLAVAYRKSATLAEGASQVVVDIPHVASDGQNAWDVQVFENGRNIEDDRSTKRRNLATYQFSVYRQPGVGPAAGILLNEREQPETIRQQIIELGGTSEYAPNDQSCIPLADAPDDWRRYLAFPLWMVSEQNLRDLTATKPDSTQALKTYVASGGQLLIYDAQGPSDKTTVESLLDLTVSEPDNSERFTAGMNGQSNLVGEPHWQYLNGRVFISSSDLRSLPTVFVDHFAEAAVRQPMGQMAILPSEDGDWFWRNMILAVGKPPVWTFCIMVTLFGAILGPGLLYFTGRVKRRSWMILLVPSLSLFATIAIITYGILYEGFGTYTRTTSVQFIDEKGNGFAWSRQSFFSGLPPREGLKIDKHAYARPVHEPGYYGYYGTPDPHSPSFVVELGDEQEWQGWLKARQQQQLLIGHPLQGASLPVKVERIDDKSLRVTNLTEHVLPVVVARGTGNDYFATGPVEVGASIEVEITDLATATATASRLSAPFRPEVPLELQSLGGSSSINWTATYSNVTISPNDVLQQAIKSYLTNELALPKHGLVALATHSELIKQPLQGSANNDMHLIIGVQKW